MGLIEDIPIPREMTFEEWNSPSLAIEYRAEYEPIFRSSMDTCKDYYTKLQEAIYTVSTYIVSYEHALESLDFSKKQLENSVEELKKADITDPNIIAINDGFTENLDENKKITSDIENKVSKMRALLDTLNEYSRRVVEVNTELDSREPWT